MRKMGDIMHDLEDLVTEMVEDHDLQFGEILNLVYGYLVVHRPDAQEVYEEDDTNPIFYYGPGDMKSDDNGEPGVWIGNTWVRLLR